MTSFLLLCTMVWSYYQVQTIWNIESIQVKQWITYVHVVGTSTYTTTKKVKVDRDWYMTTDINNCKWIQK